jgi:hypothetical protein
VNHQPDQSSISQAGQGIGVDRIDYGSGFVSLQHRRLAATLRVLWFPYRVGGVGGYDLADHHPIEEHPQCREPNLYRGFRLSLQLQLDESRDMDRLYLGKIHDACSPQKVENCLTASR